jgi:hypothetical protein
MSSDPGALICSCSLSRYCLSSTKETVVPTYINPNEMDQPFRHHHHLEDKENPHFKQRETLPLCQNTSDRYIGQLLIRWHSVGSSSNIIGENPPFNRFWAKYRAVYWKSAQEREHKVRLRSFWSLKVGRGKEAWGRQASFNTGSNPIVVGDETREPLNRNRCRVACSKVAPGRSTPASFAHGSRQQQCHLALVHCVSWLWPARKLLSEMIRMPSGTS